MLPIQENSATNDLESLLPQISYASTYFLRYYYFQRFDEKLPEDFRNWRSAAVSVSVPN